MASLTDAKAVSCSSLCKNGLIGRLSDSPARLNMMDAPSGEALGEIKLFARHGLQRSP